MSYAIAHRRPPHAGGAACGLVAALALLGCSSTIPPHTTAPAADHGLSATRTIAVGGTTRVGLQANPSTGYIWLLDTQATTGAAALRVDDAGFVQSDSGLLGAPGRHWWTITGLEAGTASLHFVSRRAWEADAPPAASRTIVIHVQ